VTVIGQKRTLWWQTLNKQKFQMTTIYETILWLISEKTGKKFPTVLFSGDTDMVTMGWISLTSVVNQDIVITRMTAGEFKDSAVGPDSYLKVETRANETLNRSDLVCPWLAKVVEPIYDVDTKKLSFQEFRKLYKKPQLFYRDIHSPDTFATVVKEVSFHEFEQQGGKLVILE
jgi:hypothetical protein